ncbi:hypothetical protein MTR67_020209 [Solanum verrucosum]|uniref:Uncharacterized protein n=1 Tax=Solanum verrucosum TaxID=315347 RepID=A0AAF0QVP9_SOLVR|nr:hypothetical protein MTR67_020209 [Solanum verrucosum]
MSVASSSSFPCIKIQNPSSSSTSYNYRFSTTLTIRSSQADGPLRRPMVQPPTPVKPTPPSPPSPSSSSPPPKQVAVEGKNVITMEFQRQKAKELQEYFKQKKLEEANQGPFFGFIGKNEISNGSLMNINDPVYTVLRGFYDTNMGCGAVIDSSALNQRFRENFVGSDTPSSPWSGRSGFSRGSGHWVGNHKKLFLRQFSNLGYMTNFSIDLSCSRMICGSTVTLPFTVKRRINGWAMFGFAVGMLTEYATGSDFVDQVKILLSNFGILDLE